MNKSEKFWDMLAGSFDKNEKRFEQSSINTICKTKKYLKKSDVVLDFGCATGTKTLEISGDVKQTYAIDISSKMIECAKRKAVEQKIENVDFAKATIFDEKYCTESFDVVIVFNILHLLENNKQVIKRITGLLRPGGLFISTTPCLAEKMDTLMNLAFRFFSLMNKIGIIPQYVERFNISGLKDLIASENLHIIETEKSFDGITGYFIAAKKI